MNSNIFPGKIFSHKLGWKQLILILAIGTIFSVAGHFAIQSTKIESGWKKINGTVIGAIENTNIDDNKTTYRPIVKYEVNGTTYEVTSSWGSSNNPTNGSTQEIAYNPDNPSEAKVIETLPVKIAFYFFYYTGIALLLWLLAIIALRFFDFRQ